MYAIKLYTDDDRLIGPFASENDAMAYRDHILYAPGAKLILMMAPTESVVSIARQKALKAYKAPPPSHHA